MAQQLLGGRRKALRGPGVVVVTVWSVKPSWAPLPNVRVLSAKVRALVSGAPVGVSLPAERAPGPASDGMRSAFNDGTEMTFV